MGGQRLYNSGVWKMVTSDNLKEISLTEVHLWNKY